LVATTDAVTAAALPGVAPSSGLHEVEGLGGDRKIGTMTPAPRQRRVKIGLAGFPATIAFSDTRAETTAFGAMIA
jgi:hypothetical protein